MVATPSKVGLGSKVTSPAASADQTPSTVVRVLSIPGVDGSRSMLVISTSLFASLTLSASEIVTFVSAAVVAESAVATGVAPPTVTDTLAGKDILPLASVTTYGTVATPSKPGAGSNATKPFASTVQTPSAVVSVLSIPGVVGSRSTVVMSESLLASVMLPASGTVVLVSAGVEVFAAVTIGGAPCTFTVTLAGADRFPSSSCTV